MTLQDRQAVIEWMGTATEDEIVQFAIDAKEEIKLRADGGMSVLSTFENNDIVFPNEPMTAIRAFCKRKTPSE